VKLLQLKGYAQGQVMPLLTGYISYPFVTNKTNKLQVHVSDVLQQSSCCWEWADQLTVLHIKVPNFVSYKGF